MRESWAKIHTELLDDAKLSARSDSDFKLWVCLILLARQTTEDGVIHKLGPHALKERFSLDCSAAKIVDALEHFKKSGMVELADGAIRILKYDKRQSIKDFHEQNAERQRRWRANNVTPAVTDDVTRVDKKRSDQIPLKPPQGGATSSHPFRSRKAKAEPYVPNCARCRKDGHSARDCPEPPHEEVPQ